MLDSLQSEGSSGSSGQLDICGGSVRVSSGGSLLVLLPWPNMLLSGICCDSPLVASGRD